MAEKKSPRHVGRHRTFDRKPDAAEEALARARAQASSIAEGAGGEDFGVNAASSSEFQIERSQDDEMTAPTREEIAAQIASSEARGDTKFARLEGKIDTLTATLVGEIKGVGAEIAAAHEYNKSTRWIVVGLIVTSVLALAGLIIALVTYGDAMFGRGMNVRDVIQSTIKETIEQQRKDQLPTAPKTDQFAPSPTPLQPPPT
jgi:hypothetical protein